MLFEVIALGNREREVMDLGDPLPVGPALDRAVCERFLGWSNWRTRTNGCLIGKPPVGRSCVPLRVSTSDALAWVHVKEPLRQMGFLVRVQEMPEGGCFRAGAGMRGEESAEIRRRAVCMLYWVPESGPAPSWWRSGLTEFGDSTAEALCRVALRVAELRE